MKQARTLSVIAVVGMCLVAYQNCSPSVQFQGAGFASGIGANGQGSAGNEIPDSSKPSDQPGDISSHPEGIEHTMKDTLSNQTDANCKGALEKIADAAQLKDGEQIIGNTGSNFFKGDHVTAVSSNHGVVKVVSAKGGRIDKISDDKGTVYICNMDVEKIQDCKGRIVIIGGSVGSVDGFSGQLEIVGGTIKGAVTNSVGVIRSR
jgi:hypothetical protein